MNLMIETEGNGIGYDDIAVSIVFLTPNKPLERTTITQIYKAGSMVYKIKSENGTSSRTRCDQGHLARNFLSRRESSLSRSNIV